MAALNRISSLPNVTDDGLTPYEDEILLLYHAGVLAGSDEGGSFLPEMQLTRAEAAAITTRMALPEKRLHFTLQ